jgi:hypothetical protein
MSKTGRETITDVLWDARPVAVAVLGFLASWLLAYAFATDLEAQVRSAAGLLQLAGVMLLVHELIERPKLWGADGIARRVSRWFGRCLRALRPRPKTVTLDVASAISGAGKLTGRGGISSGASVKAQVSFLFREVDRLHARIDEAEGMVSEKAKELGSAIAEERQERQRQHAELRSQVEGSALESLGLEWVGIVWVLLGIVMGTWPGAVTAMLVRLGWGLVTA